MKRRTFIKLAATASGAALVSCGDEDREKPSAEKPLEGAPERTSLVKLDGITSMHDHLDSEEAAGMMLEAMDRTGIARMNLLGCYPSLMHRAKSPDFEGKADNNDVLLRLIEKHPERFTAFPLIDGSEEDPVGTLVGYLGRGAKGVKMYNGATGRYRVRPMDHPDLQPLLRFCELHGIPVLVHVDPPNLEEFLRVARDYPAIPWICPHLFVQTRPKNVFRMAQCLRRYPNLHTDMSFGFEGWMHSNLSRLSESRDRVREIFIEHQDRIFFGTDIVFATDRPYRTVEWATNSYTEYRRFLELERFHHRVKDHKKVYEGEIRGLALPDEVLRKIYVENPERFLGTVSPRTDRDDLDKVLASLPEGADLGSDGPYSLVAVAAVACLSELTRPIPGESGGPERVLSTEALAGPAARRLGIDPSSVEILPDSKEVKNAAAFDPKALGIVALADMEPRLRAMEIASIEPCLPGIRRCSEAGEATMAAYFGEYPLLIPLSCDPENAAEHRFDPHEIRTVILTGTSLLGDGMGPPLRSSPEELVEPVAPVFQAADVAHVSLENMMRERCEQDMKKWRFCYEPDQLESLDHLGIDVIDLTGNHLTDWNQETVRSTLDEYRKRGFQYFAGGKDLDDAVQPAVFPVRGLKIGFIGINRVNTETSGAKRKRAGSLTPPMENHERSLALVKERADTFFFTYQGGYEFSPLPCNDIVKFAHSAIDAGAICAVGLHAHSPMGVAVYDGAFVAYGPGNFLFRHPKSIKPKNELTELGIGVRTSLYGKRLLQTDLIPLHMGERHVSRMEPEEAKPLLDWIRRASRPGLAPERPLPHQNDAFVEIYEPDSIRGPWRTQIRIGLTSILVGLTERSARDAGSPEEAMSILEEARSRYQRWGGTHMRIALNLLEGWSLPDRTFHAVRVHLGSEPSPALVRAAAESGVPVQLIVDRPLSVNRIAPLLSGCSNARILLSGIAMFTEERESLASLLEKHGNLYVDTSGRDHGEYSSWFSSIERDPEGWRRFFDAFRHRILLGTGCSTDKRRMKWSQYPRVTRAIRWGLEEESFFLPVLARGNVGEWHSYDYSAEKRVGGLSLDTSIVDAVMYENYERLFGPLEGLAPSGVSTPVRPPPRVGAPQPAGGCRPGTPLLRP